MAILMGDPFALDKFLGGFNLDVKEDPNVWIPQPGDKVTLTDDFYDGLTDGKECAKLARLPYCIVDEVHAIPTGENGDYHWEYDITIKETGYMVGFGYEQYRGT